MAQQGPNPVELYEAAAQYLRPILAGVSSNQLNNATPCTEWNVQQLVTHNIKVTAFALGMLQGNITVNPMDVSGDIPAEGAENAFVAGTNRVLDFVKSADLSKVTDTPFGPMPLAQIVMFPTLDMTIHKWDLAKATNQDTLSTAAWQRSALESRRLRQRDCGRTPRTGDPPSARR